MTCKVKFPNTPESDQAAKVWHVVTFDDGTTMDVLAEDPETAMTVARFSNKKYLGKYCCGDHYMCGCGGGWFDGKHITHDMFRKPGERVGERPKEASNAH